MTLDANWIHMMLMKKLPKPEMVMSQSGGEYFFVFMVMSVPNITPGKIAYTAIFISSKSQ